MMSSDTAENLLRISLRNLEKISFINKRDAISETKTTRINAECHRHVSAKCNSTLLLYQVACKNEM